MIPSIETAPVMSLRPQDVGRLVDALHAYHAISSPVFQRSKQRLWSADYLWDLLLDNRRKAIEPMVLELHGADFNAIRAMQQFVSEGVWCDETLVQRHWREVDQTLGDEDGVLPLDGSGFLKQSKASVDVNRQSVKPRCLWAIPASGAIPRWIDACICPKKYLPKEWGDDDAFAARRYKCGMPSDIIFQTTPESGWEMIRQVVDDQQLRARWVTCDEAFGCTTTLLPHVAGSGLWYFA